MLKRILATVAVALILAGHATAGTFEDAHAAYRRGDYAMASALLKPIAEQGDIRAQFLLGGLYQDGLGVAQDYAVAAKWYQRAAEQGDAGIQFVLGGLYQMGGPNLPQDYTAAAKWYRLAAEQGEPGAQDSLGLLYESGLGLPRDYAEAARWYCRAAGGKQDHGTVGAARVDCRPLISDEFADLVTLDPPSDAQTRQPFRLHAQFRLASLYEHGEGVAQDYAEAKRWYRRAADQGLPDAQFGLGRLFERGQGVPQDYAEAARWYRLAADQGEAVAQLSLGVLHEKGEGVPKDYAEAASWYRRSAEQGTAAAQLSLGALYLQGAGVPQDYVLAHMWLNLAAATGLDVAIELRDRVASSMTPDQIAKAQRLAREWNPKPER